MDFPGVKRGTERGRSSRQYYLYSPFYFETAEARYQNLTKYAFLVTHKLPVCRLHTLLPPLIEAKPLQVDSQHPTPPYYLVKVVAEQVFDLDKAICGTSLAILQDSNASRLD